MSTNFGELPDPNDETSLVGLTQNDPNAPQAGQVGLTPVQQKNLAGKDKLGIYEGHELEEKLAPAIPKDGKPFKVFLPVNEGPAPQPADEKPHDRFSSAAQAQRDEKNYEKLEEEIKTMAAINGGSTKPLEHMDEAVLARVRAGASTMELTNLRNKLATVAGFTSSGEAIDIDPNKLQPSPVTAEMEPSIETAKEKKERENRQFEELRRQKERQNNA